MRPLIADSKINPLADLGENKTNSDDLISKLIDEVSETDKNFWSDPEHNRRNNVHSLFQYPAMMVPTVQQNLIKIILQVEKDIKNIIDPFTGSSTSLIAGMQEGLNCWGQDINPLAVLLSKVKLGPYFYSAFSSHFEYIKSKVREDTSDDITASFPGIDKWFKKEVQIRLSKLVRVIRCLRTVEARRFFWIALAETIRFSSNDRTSTYKLHARPDDEIKLRNIDPIKLFNKIVDRNLVDLNEYAENLKDSNLLYKGRYNGTAMVGLLDSTKEIIQNKRGLFDLLVSSSPYGDNKTTVPYGQHAYLPLQWIDLEDIDSKVTSDFLKSTAEIDNRSLGGSLKKLPEEPIEKLFSKSPTLKSTIRKLSVNNADKTTKVINFIHDFDQSLSNCIGHLKPNSYLIWTIGNRRVGGFEIKNADILKELLENKGALHIKTIHRDILNKRMAQRNGKVSTMNQEEILIFRKIG